MTILLKAIYRFNVIPIKLPMVFFTELEQIISKFVWKHKSPQTAKAILRRMELEESTSLTSDHIIKLQALRHYGTGIKTALWTNVFHWSTFVQIESPEINPCTYRHLIFDKRGKNIHQRKDSLFNKWCWENQAPTWNGIRAFPNTTHTHTHTHTQPEKN